ncbi:uncharacterized protein LOC134719474 isoform X2 [Mytilus trossulus]
MTWDPTDLVVAVEDKVKDVHNVGQEDKTGFLDKCYKYQLEVNLTVKSDLFGFKQNPSVGVVANFIDVMWKQEDQKNCPPTFCNLKVSKFEMGLNEEVNLTVKSDLFGFKQNPSVGVVANFIDVKWKQEDQKKCLPTLCSIKVSKFEMGLNEGFCKVETYQIIQRVGCGQNKEEEKAMDWNKKDPDKMNKIKTNILNKTKYGMILVLLLSAFCSVSSAKNIDDDCLQTSVSGFVNTGDLVFHCKCKCSCSQNWRWSGGPNNVDLTTNQQVLSSYIEKINITENPPGVHDYSITMNVTETDFMSDFTCHNGFATKKINRSELLQHVSPPSQYTVTSTMSSPEQPKTSVMLTHEQTRTTTMSTLKPTMTSYISKMSDGEKAGIVFGSFIVVALLVGAAVFLGKRRCNQQKQDDIEAGMPMKTRS